MPKIVDHDRSRAEFAEAVWRAVVDLGIENATVRTVAEYAGWSVGRLSHYFASKDDLLEYAMGYIGGEMQRRFDRRLRALRGLEALRALLDEVTPSNRRRREEWIFWIAFWGRATRNAKLAAAQRRRHAGFRHALERCLGEAHAAGEIDASIDLAHEAAGIAALAWGIGVLATFEPRVLVQADIERELDARVARLRVNAASAPKRRACGAHSR
jgi:AcrR family transcriptional regulator